MKDLFIKGNTTELLSIAYLQNLGCDISIPFGSLRYDFIIDYKNKLYKVQAKSATVRKNNSILHLYLTSGNNKRVKKYEDYEIDFFCTYCNNVCYLIPKSEINTKELTLRLENTKNFQKANIHFARDYIAENILEKL